MLEEFRSPADGNGPATAEALEAAADAALDASSAKGMLQEAIHRVMEEIELHEREAKKHKQQAEELRRDLRESMSYLLGQKVQGKALGAILEGSAGKKDGQAASDETPRAETKKKASSRRGRGRKK